MLTLDTLRRMADRMPTEPTGDSGSPPYRRPDAGLRVRSVRLPTVREESRRARGLFAFVVSVSLAVMVPTGIVVTHGAQLVGGDPPSWEVLLHTGLWFAGWTLGFIVPFAGLGLFLEVRRYRRARRHIGERATVDVHGVLRSEDGLRVWP